jgi:hypothetical protein
MQETYSMLNADLFKNCLRQNQSFNCGSGVEDAEHSLFKTNSLLNIDATYLLSKGMY